MKWVSSSLILIIVALATHHDKILERWGKRIETARKHYKDPPKLYPNWQYLTNFATPERKGKSMFFFHREELLKYREFLPRRFVSIPCYFYEPKHIIVNQLERIDEVDLIYTEGEYYEALESELKKLNQRKNFKVVLRYGDYQLLERKPN